MRLHHDQRDFILQPNNILLQGTLEDYRFVPDTLPSGRVWLRPPLSMRLVLIVRHFTAFHFCCNA